MHHDSDRVSLLGDDEGLQAWEGFGKASVLEESFFIIIIIIIIIEDHEKS